MEKVNKFQGIIKIAEEMILETLLFANHRTHIHLLGGPSLPGSLLPASME
jgi:hypothetical protein